MSRESDLREWLGDVLWPNLKMRGLPSILAAAPQRAWSATTGGIDYLKFNTQDQHFAIDPDIKITGLAGIYDAPAYPADVIVFIILNMLFD